VAAGAGRERQEEAAALAVALARSQPQRPRQVQEPPAHLGRLEQAGQGVLARSLAWLAAMAGRWRTLAHQGRRQHPDQPVLAQAVQPVSLALPGRRGRTVQAARRAIQSPETRTSLGLRLVRATDQFR